MFSSLWKCSFTLLSILGASAMPLPVARDDSSPKFVVAHFMIGNAYPYTPDLWTSDIKLAQSYGLDGFALNIGTDDWQFDRVTDAYNAASALNFKLFISYDMAVLPCTASTDMALLQKYFSAFNSHAAQLVVNGKPLVSTFSGDQCTFGAANPAAGWTAVLSGQNTEFVPAFFPSDMNEIAPGQPLGNLINGIFNWNGGWPTNLVDTVVKDILSIPTDLLSGTLQSQLGSMSSDDQWLTAVGLPNTESAASSNSGKTYIASASPHFYTHYGGSLDKNFAYVTDDHAFARRWDNLVKAREHIDIVEIVSWNDYGESHYVGPTNTGAMPAGTTWVDGYDHQGWLRMVSYYAQAFKTGTYPAVTEDQVVFWARPHSRAATASSDPLGKPANVDLLSDNFWAWILLADNTGLSQVTLSTSPSNSKVFTLPAGANQISIPLMAGGPLHATVSRAGKTTVDLSSSNYTFIPEGGALQAYNFNAAVFASS